MQDATEQRLARVIGQALPILRALAQAQPRGDGGGAGKTGPAHGARMGVNALAAAKFPDAGIRLQRQRRALPRHLLQEKEQAFIAGLRQPFVEEHRRGGQDDAAISVMLHLAHRRIAYTHRAMAFKAFQVGRNPLGKVF